MAGGYGTDEGFSDYAEANGYTVPAGNITASRARGSNYIDGAYGDRFTGTPTGGVDQERAWPRTGASAYGVALPSDVIPRRVVNAAYEAALIELTTPGSLSVVVSNAERVVREKVGELEVAYAAPGADAVGDASPIISIVAGLLEPLLIAEPAQGVGIWSVGR